MKKFSTVVLDYPRYDKIKYLNEDGRKDNWDNVFTLWTDDFDKCAKFKTWDEALSVRLRITSINDPYIKVKAFVEK
jgi:hypothetical protein